MHQGDEVTVIHGIPPCALTPLEVQRRGRQRQTTPSARDPAMAAVKHGYQELVAMSKALAEHRGRPFGKAVPRCSGGGLQRLESAR